MKKILVVSDTHGYTGNLEAAIRENKNIDLMIHLGDVCNDKDYIQAMVNFPVKFVRGNNDWSRDLPDRAVMDICGHKIFAAHGHDFYVRKDASRIRNVAMENGCDIVMFGHTHIPLLEQDEKVTLINPGSLTYPRQSGHKPSYIIMEIDNEENVQYMINYIAK